MEQGLTAAGEAPPRRTGRSFRRRLGFTLGGIVVALALSGQIMFIVSSVRNGSLLNAAGGDPQVPKHGTPIRRLDAMLATVLGPGDRGIRRFRITGWHVEPSNARLKDLTVAWAINNDLSAGTVGNGAAVDVYAMLRAVYTSGLPIGDVHLVGTYPMPQRHGGNRKTVVMRLVLERKIADTIGKDGWNAFDPQGIWPLIGKLYVNPQLQPLPQE